MIPPDSAPQPTKKRYSEELSNYLAIEVADSLRGLGFASIKPERRTITSGKRAGSIEIKKEKEFQGGLGPKRVDVSFSDDRHGLLLALSIKTLNFPSFPPLRGTSPPKPDFSKPNFSKNVKNRFGDLTTESITLHMRFPFAVVGCLYVMPERSHTEKGRNMRISTFERASLLYATISGRRVYGDPAERFEDVTLMLYRPLASADRTQDVRVKLFSAGPVGDPLEENGYFLRLRELYNERNPHAMIGEDADEGDVDFEDVEADEL
ncbi:MAG: hypothetical protein ACRD26_01040 [Vicinamibacterales bacterium]